MYDIIAPNRDYDNQNGYPSRIQLNQESPLKISKLSHKFEMPQVEPFKEKIQCSIECGPNEICTKSISQKDQFVCVCPQSLGFYRINNVCREYLTGTSTCDTQWNNCHQTNQECVSFSEYTNKGTCQCLFDYRRNLETGECVQQIAQVETDNILNNDQYEAKVCFDLFY